MTAQGLHEEAVLAAEMVLAKCGAEPGAPVPIFDLIEDRGVWLTFEPMKVPLGAYFRLGETAGIAINVERPVPLQRFTAAHELGHHELGHESQVDDEAAIGHQNLEPHEIQAQTFAASLLMSELSIEVALEDRQHDPLRPDLTALDCYVLSSAFGVSYSAIVTQLGVLRKISPDVAMRLKRVPPMKLKTEILGGRRPHDNWATVHQVGLRDNTRGIVVETGDELSVSLPQMMSEDSVWTISPRTSGGLELRSDSVQQPAEATLFGGSGERSFVLRVSDAGVHHLEFLLLSSAADPGDKDASFTVDVEARATPVPSSSRGLSVNQQDQLFEVGR